MEQEFKFMSEVKVEQPKKKDIYFDGYFKNKPRPDNNSSEVKRLVVEDILNDVMDWLEQGNSSSRYGDGDDSERDEVREELINTVESHKDGYGMVKDLDRNGWDCDSNLVEIFDNLHFYDARKKLVQKWIKDNDIKPKYDVGQGVVVSSKYLSHKQKPSYKGEIVRVYEDGTYSIKIPELGHVNTGIGTYGIILDWDKVEDETK